MTRLDFKLWLVRNGYNQKTLAKKLGITETTLSNYNSSGRYPMVFQLALQFLDGLDNNE